MIDQFLIFNTRGQILFRHQPHKLPDSVINNFIDEVFISNTATISTVNNVQSYAMDKHIVKFIQIHTPDLIAACFYNKSIPVMYVDSLLDISIKLFKQLLGESISKNSEHQKPLLDNCDEELDKFEQYFLLKLVELQTEKETEKVELEHGDSKRKDSKKETKKDIKKKQRKWGADGSVEETNDGVELDYSNDTEGSNQQQITIDKEGFGNKNSQGLFVVKDLNEEIDELLSKSNEPTKEPFAFFKKFAGGKTINQEDIKSTVEELQKHLIKKNVAPEIARELTTNVEKSLIGSKTKNWTTVTSTAKEALTKELTKILTPGTSVNLLEDIKKNKKPYVISVVGVNGVGKSTNLSKLAFWLLQNDFKVLITACDTFRSGAVEQLRVHVNNLKTATDKQDQIELFEGGYGGSDLVAKIAKNAIEYAKKNGFDIVLMDTAGRRHNDAQLMTPLASFAKAANPNKIIMVGEALVGTDSVQQAKNFNSAFGSGRQLDFFIISKCDTVGDMIGTMVNMVVATKIPILFVGVGQTYTDLRTLSVEWAVNTLMS
jgi:signal recognition particle receptor subunit alpha